MKMSFEKYKAVRAFFDRDCSKYMRERYEQGCSKCKGLAYITRREIILRMANDGSGVWLDAGCGPGPLVSELARKGMTVIGLDLSVEMVRFADQSMKRHGHNKSSFLVGNVDFLSLRDNSFDGVILLGVLSYVPDIRTTMKEMYRVLKPGGIGIAQIANRLSLPEGEIRFFFPIWNYFRGKCSREKREKVRFSMNPYGEFGLSLKSYYTFGFDELCRSLGFRNLTSNYFDFRIPVVWKILPEISGKLSVFLTNKSYSKYLSFLASGYILSIKK